MRFSSIGMIIEYQLIKDIIIFGPNTLKILAVKIFTGHMIREEG